MSAATLSAPEQGTAFAVDAPACVRCAGCATVAPGHFSVRAGPARVVRAPATSGEQRACEAAAAICPTQAITAAQPVALTGVAEARPGELYPLVMDVAEGVRWKVSELPWASFDAAKATAGLVAVVREMAWSEQTTFTATRRFLETFADDTPFSQDFSQWVSVWFYEETRHPLVLLRWLAQAGDVPPADFMATGREAAPFMKSLTGTLVTNIISEMVAAEAYLGMVGGAPEPLITRVVERLAADEARHAASFFTYARRAIEVSAEPDRERLDALKVLHFWFNISKNVSHPVNVAMKRLVTLLPAVGAPPFVPPNDRIARVVGLLTGLPIERPADVPVQLVEYTRRLQAAS